MIGVEPNAILESRRLDNPFSFEKGNPVARPVSKV